MKPVKKPVNNEINECLAKAKEHILRATVGGTSTLFGLSAFAFCASKQNPSGCLIGAGLVLLAGGLTVKEIYEARNLRRKASNLSHLAEAGEHVSLQSLLS